MKTEKVKTEKITIGRHDRIDLPDFGITSIDAKIDTGAYTSSLGCKNVREEYVDGETVLKFQIIDHTGEQDAFNKEFTATDYSKRKVRTSNDHVHERYSIKTHLLIFGQAHLVEFTLTDRARMKFPVLLGRKFLHNKFVVDPRKTLLSFKKAKV
ncbi:MAG: ATP-dependent zinc protease [Flavobacteriales bacterium]|nr:ATP-dependent zinc protease [Flavobacteriales bacterium]